jgi:hypothetical protein
MHTIQDHRVARFLRLKLSHNPIMTSDVKLLAITELDDGSCSMRDEEAIIDELDLHASPTLDVNYRDL